MKTALFLFVLTNLQFYAAVSAHAQLAGDPVSGIDENCGNNPDDPERETVLFLSRFGLFLQSSSSQVTPDSQGIAGGSGEGTSSSPFSVSMVFSSGTNSATAPLVRRGGVVYSFPETTYSTYMTNFAFETETALSAAFPAASYSAEYNSDGSIISVSRTVAEFNLPTPTISNFDELQSFPIGQAFTIRWSPFENANSKDSTITLRIEEIDDQGGFLRTVFIAPDYCKKLVLRPTDAEITVPATILQPGKKYQGELFFGRTGYEERTTVPSLLFDTLDSKQTRFPLGGAVSGGGTESPATVRSIVPAGNGKFTVTFNTPGASSVIVETSVDLKTWSLYAQMPAGPAGVTAFDLTPSASERTRFYRVRTFY
ncbi:MAG: hypothetical protein ABI651_02460 [Verrucomicrobiota bacterium]